jgi:hypothetical protein
MAEFDPKSGERCERVDDAATAVTGAVITLVGVCCLLNRTISANRVAEPLFFPHV